MTELLLAHILIDHDVTIFDEIHSPIVHYTELLIDHRIDKIHDLDIDHVHTPETDNSRSTLRHINLLLDRMILELLDLDLILKQKIK